MHGMNSNLLFGGLPQGMDVLYLEYGCVTDVSTWKDVCIEECGN